jgi:hypothetical protein
LFPSKNGSHSGIFKVAMPEPCTVSKGKSKMPSCSLEDALFYSRRCTQLPL